MSSAIVGIVGGGPAGAALAIRLSRLGHRVTIIADCRQPYGLQSLSDRAIVCLKSLDAVQALAVIGPRSARVVLWNGRSASPNDEYLVSRPEFDAALRRDAEATGATVLRGRADIGDSTTEAAAVSAYSRTTGLTTVTADIWIDARGRTAHRKCRSAAVGAPALAVTQEFRVASDRPFSGIAALEDGWFWIATRADGVGVVQRVVAGGRGRVRGIQARDLVAELIAGQRELPHAFTGAKRSGPVRAFPAAAALSAGHGMLRAGDALHAPDPLSGHGVYEALSSTINIAAAVNTCLRTPENAPLARRFVLDRARERYEVMGRTGAHAYGREKRWPGSPFWSARQASNSPDGQARPLGSSIVRGAPVLDRNLIVPASVLITTHHPRGVWRVEGVPVVHLLTCLRNGVDTDDAARALDVSRGQAHRAASWLRHEGLLENARP